MLMLKLWYRLAGYVVISIRGPRGVKFLNLAAARGIFIWRVRRVDKSVLRACVGIEGFKALRRIASITGCRVRIEEKAGLPFFMRKLRSRKAMILGFAFSILVLWFLSNSIWFVRVNGEKKDYADVNKAIIALLDKKGIESGTPKSRIDTDAISEDIMDSDSSLAWVGVTLRGTLLRVEYVRKVLPNKETMKESDIHSSRDGVITKLIVFTGTPRVVEGEPVKAGQVLIEGRNPPRIEEIPSDGENPPQTREIQGERVRARGLVEASVAYEGYGESYLREAVTERTGRSGRVMSFKLFGRPVQIGRMPDYREYEVKTKHLFVKEWRKKRVPVEIQETDFMETHTIIKRITHSQALRTARESALRDARSAIGPKARIQGITYEGIQGIGNTGSKGAEEQDPDLVRVRVIVEALESVGVEKRR